MGIEASKEAQAMVRAMVVDEAGGYLLLHLPTKEYGVMWHQGINVEFAESVAQGRYAEGCSVVGSLQDAVSFIQNGSEKQIQLNPLMREYLQIPEVGLIADTLREFDGIMEPEVCSDSGFYWVRYDGYWTIGEHDTTLMCDKFEFALIGYDAPVKVDQIGERIIRPDSTLYS